MAIEEETVVAAEASGELAIQVPAKLARSAGRPPFMVQRPADSFFKWFVRQVCGLEVQNVGLMPPGPFMVCTNHRSHLDSVVIVAALALSLRDSAMMAAHDYFFANRRRRILAGSIFNLIPFERDMTMSGFRRTVAASEAFLAAGGRAIISYPEGGRSAPGIIRPFKRGPMTVALALGLPILPAFISGTDLVMPKGRRGLEVHPLAIRFGTPLSPAEFAGDASLAARSRAMTQALESRIRALGGDPRSAAADVLDTAPRCGPP